MKKYNRTCKACRKEYDYCNTCSHKDPSWKNMFCSEECLDLFDLTIDYKHNRVTKDEVRERISGMKLGNYRKYEKGIVKMLDEVTRKTASFVERIPELLK